MNPPVFVYTMLKLPAVPLTWSPALSSDIGWSSDNGCILPWTAHGPFQKIRQVFSNQQISKICLGASLGATDQVANSFRVLLLAKLALGHNHLSRQTAKCLKWHFILICEVWYTPSDQNTCFSILNFFPNACHPRTSLHLFTLFFLFCPC